MRRKIILASMVDRDVASLVEEARERIERSVVLPAGYCVQFGGSFENQQRAMRNLTVLMAVVVLLIFVILFSSFGSMLPAALIILTVPLSLVGAILQRMIAMPVFYEWAKARMRPVRTPA